MLFSDWALLTGVLLISITLSGSLMKRLPISIPMLYLALGFGLGSAGLGLVNLDPRAVSGLLERVAEIAVLISLFSVGLRLGMPFSIRYWRMPLRLAFLSMGLTVGLMALAGNRLMDLSWGAAILLAAILAPTDPVLASDVQVNTPNDRDALRFSLTGEGGLNDGAAFPLVTLGLGLLGVHGSSPWALRWLTMDVAWGLTGGLLIGGVCGALIGQLVVYLRTRHHEAVGLDEFLSVGLLALAFGLAQLMGASGFLSVFTAGLALQRVKESSRFQVAPGEGTAGLQNTDAHYSVATHPNLASAYMMQAVRGFNGQLERIAELVIVLAVGAMLAHVQWAAWMAGYLALLFFVVRPVSVYLGLLGASVSPDQRGLIAWFGIRGIGSVYYLLFALNQGLPDRLADMAIGLTLLTVAVSIVLHGLSVVPLMALYARRKQR